MPDTKKEAFITVRVPPELHEQAYAVADQKDATLSDLLRAFLRELTDESA